jgi:hypothetical protein
MLSEGLSHDLGHLRQIAELYRARAFTPIPARSKIFQSETVTEHPEDARLAAVGPRR